MKLLLVEDDPDMLPFYAATLRQFQVTRVSSAEQARAAAERTYFPLAIINWELPGATGLELCNALRRRPLQPYTYVLLVTAHAGRGCFLEAMDSGADDFISKPLDQETLAARLRVATRVLALQGALTRLSPHPSICGSCCSVKGERGWERLDRFISSHTKIYFSHGLCPPCYTEARADFR